MSKNKIRPQYVLLDGADMQVGKPDYSMRRLKVRAGNLHGQMSICDISEGELTTVATRQHTVAAWVRV